MNASSIKSADDFRVVGPVLLQEGGELLIGGQSGYACREIRGRGRLCFLQDVPHAAKKHLLTSGRLDVIIEDDIHDRFHPPIKASEGAFASLAGSDPSALTVIVASSIPVRQAEKRERWRMRALLRYLRATDC